MHSPNVARLRYIVGQSCAPISWPSVPWRFSASAPTRIPPPSGSRSTTPHFTVVTDASEKQARHIAGQFERMQAVFHKILPGAHSDPGAPIVVLALKNRRDFQTVEPAEYLAKGKLDLAGALPPEQRPQLHPPPSRRRRRPSVLLSSTTSTPTTSLATPTFRSGSTKASPSSTRTPTSTPTRSASASPVPGTSSACARKACFLSPRSSPSTTTRPTTTTRTRAPSSTPNPGPSPTCCTSTTSATRPTSSATI